ncbi:MAG: ANTAR domain-containing protein [Lachnospiraceae bacterium]|nr:ANTAR domain-containing protein [Lachnospiraceae bacterium]
MTGIIVAFPKTEDAKGIKNLLVRNGFSVLPACTSGSQVLSQADGLNGGIVICGYKLPDMIYSELNECLPPGFEMLLMASPRVLAGCADSGIVCLPMPVRIDDLVNTADMMVQAAEARRRRQKGRPRERSSREKALIQEAKAVLMDRNNMTEEEAHRYIQKCSMDSGTGMTETAEMVLSAMKT